MPSEGSEASTGARFPEPRWSVALSGGGHRAALFGIGALISLADNRVAARTDSVVSVSGGSMANGVLADRCDFARASGEEVREAFLGLIGLCASTGTVQYSRHARRVLVAGAAALAAFLAAQALGGAGGAGRAVRMAAAGLVGGLYQSLSHVAELTFADLLYGDTMLADLNRPDRPVAHVFCATELQSREHLYFSPRFALGLPSRFTGHLRMRLATAVQASAAFPVFPPRMLSARRAGFASSAYRWLWLSDGGVYDNMGDEWARSYWAQVKRFPQLRRLAQPPERLLVVNATAMAEARPASWLAAIPLVGVLAARVREIGIMHGDTTATRRVDLVAQFDQVRRGGHGAPKTVEEAERLSLSRTFIRPPIGGTLIHIGTAADWPMHHEVGSRDPTASALSAVKAKLAQFPDRDRLGAARDVARDAPLTLGKLPVETVVDLLWHGYMLTMTNLAVFESEPYVPLPRRDMEALVQQALARSESATPST